MKPESLRLWKFAGYAMMRTWKLRVLLTLVATLFAAAIGTLAGRLAGRAWTLRVAESALVQTAARTIAEADASSLESRVVLAKMNASPYAYCSDAEISYMRGVLFQSEYLKEAGRMRAGKIDCSATLGRLDRPIQEPAPDFLQTDGTRVYKKFPPFRVGELTVLALQSGNAYVVFSPFLETHRAAPPMHYISTASDDPNVQAGVLLGTTPQAERKILTRDAAVQLNGSLYATRCSTRYFNCMTDWMTVPDALQAGRRQVGEAMILGCLAGALLGLALSLLYRRNRSMEQQLRRAIRGDGLTVVYQPIVNLTTRRIVGAEVLARWTDEDGFEVSPDVFVRVAEARGFVGEITKLVVRHALRDLAEMLCRRPIFRLSINVAAEDLSDPEFLPMLDGSLEWAEVEARNLVIEITERSTASHELAVKTIQLLHEKGYSVHIDDFGTGYSSLSYLHALAIDAIKIDKSFTQAIGTEAVTVGILPQILSMAAALNLEVIAEGIETVEQAEYFVAAGTGILAQGWFFGRPVPVREFVAQLAEDEKWMDAGSDNVDRSIHVA
jgi:sensor c-di-GMP phosphodiesterase-like protein